MLCKNLAKWRKMPVFGGKKCHFKAKNKPFNAQNPTPKVGFCISEGGFRWTLPLCLPLTAHH